jgi:hypothetical protein
MKQLIEPIVQKLKIILDTVLFIHYSEDKNKQFILVSTTKLPNKNK